MLLGVISCQRKNRSVSKMKNSVLLALLSSQYNIILYHRNVERIIDYYNRFEFCCKLYTIHILLLPPRDGAIIINKRISKNVDLNYTWRSCICFGLIFVQIVHSQYCMGVSPIHIIIIMITPISQRSYICIYI